MKQDRSLLAILIGIVVLIVLSLVVFFVRQSRATYLTDGSPGAVVTNFVLAIDQHDFERAYGYLADTSQKPGLDTFRAFFLNSQPKTDTSAVSLGATEISGDQAVVYMSFQQGGGPFREPYRDTQVAQLTRQNGEWKITAMPWYYWDYAWTVAVPAQPTVK